MIDIILCCYNQESFIKEALESIFSQDFTENANLIIADDCSTDKTMEIIKNTPEPNWIKTKYLSSKKNLGMCENYKRAFCATESDFVFILEGDDFWHSTHHLAQHVNFLREHPSISMTMNRFMTLNTVEKKIAFSLYKNEWGDYKEFSQEEIIKKNKLGNLSACCFRGNLIRNLPDNLFRIFFADWLLGMIMSEQGNIAVLKECTSVYRIIQTSQWSKFCSKKLLQKELHYAKIYDKFFNYKYHSIFKICSQDLKKKLSLNLLSKIKTTIKQKLNMTNLYSYKELQKMGFKSLGKNIRLSRKASVYSAKDITIGNNVRIDDFCILSGNITLGSNIHISAYSALYGAKGIVLEDFTGISPRTTIFSAMDDFTGGKLIGPIHDDELTNVTGGKVVLRRFSQLGAGTTVFPNIEIGEGAVTGSMTLVNKDLSPWTINTGIPVNKSRPRKNDYIQKMRKFLDFKDFK